MTCLGYEFAVNASRFQPRQLDSMGEAYVQRQTFFGGFSDDDDDDVDDDNDIMKDGGNKYGTLILIQIKTFRRSTPNMSSRGSRTMTIGSTSSVLCSAGQAGSQDTAFASRT